MKVSWGAVGIIIGLILVAASILAGALMAGRRLSGLERENSIMGAGIKRTIIAQGYAFSKTDSEKRTITLEDLKEGYALAKICTS